MKNADQILSSIAEALAAGRLVLMTDGTVTRKVIQAEITDSALPITRNAPLMCVLRGEDGYSSQSAGLGMT